MSARILHCGRFALELSRPRVMGILNVTPDSFSDGGRFPDAAAAIAGGRRMIADGATLVDVGGESTRPGAAPTAEADELARVLPVVEALAADGIPVSVDTRKPAVMRAAIGAGAAMINDVSALAAPGAIAACAAGGVAVCLMHMRGDPATMQAVPAYDDVLGEVRDFLVRRAATCVAGGIAGDRIVLDPGFGFGKTLAHNLALLRGLPTLVAAGYPVLAGLSRKSMLGALTGRAVEQRTAASLAAAIMAVAGGAAIVRVHDVAETVDALKVWQALQDETDRG
jgi:dihydropteroate synthase